MTPVYIRTSALIVQFRIAGAVPVTLPCVISVKPPIRWTIRIVTVCLVGPIAKPAISTLHAVCVIQATP